MKKLLIFIICLFLGHSLFSQGGMLKRADENYQKLAYATAAENYEKVRGTKKEDPQMLARLANCYYQMGKSKKAEEIYALMINDPTANYEDVYRYAMTLKENSKYEESALWIEKFMAIDRADLRAIEYKKTPNYLQDILDLPARFEVKNIDINTEKAEFGGYYDANRGDVYFVSNRKYNGFSQRFWSGNNTPFLDMFRGKLGTGNQIIGQELILDGANSNFHDGPVAFHPDGNKVFFTRNNLAPKRSKRYDDKGIQNLKLYYADIEKDGSWTNIREVPYNNMSFSVGHPTFSKDGRTMYFVSDMPGGYGGADIYKASVSEGMVEMVFGTPINLGNTINTEGQEMFPWLDTAQNLFFASDGLPGLGGLDLFVVTNIFDKKNNLLPQNLGEPMNSNRDDFAFIMLNDGETGFISSNRFGGKGDDDIYSFVQLEPYKKELKLKGRVVDTQVKSILPDAKVVLIDAFGDVVQRTNTDENGEFSITINPKMVYKVGIQNSGYMEKFEIFSTEDLNENVTEIDKTFFLMKDPDLGLYALVTDNKTGEPLQGVKMKIVDLNSGEVIIDDLTPQSGDILKALNENKIGDCLKYQIILSKSGYLGKTAQFNECIDKSGLVNIHQKLDLGMDKIEVGMDLAKIINIKMIYFDLNKYNIRPDAQLELAKIVQVMNDNPTMEIELGSHTDCRASFTYNEKLSDNRAKSSAAWVRERITNPQRIYGKGYGESKLVNDCACEGNVKSNCSEEDHQLNRRTEFIITKM